MSSARMVRGTKSRFIIYVSAALVFCGLTYLFHNSQTQLDEARRTVASCTQQQESLSAQLQVIFEYKLRLEKSLQKEKTEHKDTRDECLNKAQEEKLQREKESLEALNKYNALQQSYKLMQTNHKDLTEECDKVRKTQLDTAEEVSKLEHQVQSLRQELQQVKDEGNKTSENYKLQYQALLQEKEQLEKDNARLTQNNEPVSDRVEKLELQNKQLEEEVISLKTALAQCKAGTLPGKGSVNIEAKLREPGQDSLAAAAQESINNVGAEPPKVLLTGSSTTPVINPDAVLDHDDPLRQGQKEGFNKPSSTAASLIAANKPTQEAAPPPLVVPDQPSDRQVDSPQVDQNQLDNTRQLAPPESFPHQNVVIPVGPMNPVQQDPSKLLKDVEINGRKMNNPDLNNAEEEDRQRENDIRPREYRGEGNYDEEDEDEGEQLDYGVKQQPQIPQIHNHPPQSRHLNRQGGGGSIMINPK